MRLVKYESYIVTVKSASCLPAGEYLLYFQNVVVFEETCSCGLAILNFSESLDDIQLHVPPVSGAYIHDPLTP